MSYSQEQKDSHEAMTTGDMTEEEVFEIRLSHAVKTLVSEVKSVSSTIGVRQCSKRWMGDTAPHAPQVQSVGEQLVFIGGSHDWGPGKLTDSQVGWAMGCWLAARLSLQGILENRRHDNTSVLQLDITLARVQEAMRGIKAVMTVLRRSAVAQSGKAAAGTRNWCFL